MVGGKALCAGQKRSLVVRSKRLEFRGGLLTGEMIIIIYMYFVLTKVNKKVMTSGSETKTIFHFTVLYNVQLHTSI